MQIWSVRYSRCIHCIHAVFSTVCKCVCHCIHCMHTQSMLYYCCIHCMHCCVRCMHCGCLADQSIASLWLCDLLQHYLLICRVHLVQLGKGLVVLPCHLHVRHDGLSLPRSTQNTPRRYRQPTCRTLSWLCLEQATNTLQSTQSTRTKCHNSLVGRRANLLCRSAL